MIKEINLGELPLGKTAIVTDIKNNTLLMKRIINLGVTKGAEITPLFRAPFGDPTAYAVKGCVVALRKSDCAGILVMINETEENSHEAI